MKPIEVTTPELPDAHIMFVAALSNGEVITEGKGDYAWIDGLKSPWQRLIRYTIENNITITSLSLITPDGHTFGLPPMGKPRFRGYANLTAAEKPLDYEVARFLARDMDVIREGNKGTVQSAVIAEFYTIAKAIYKEFTIEVWVDELKPAHSWTAIRYNK